MSQRCELTGKGAQVGHKVSHSNRKTKRRFLPNLCNVTLVSEALGRRVRLRVFDPGICQDNNLIPDAGAAGSSAVHADYA